MAVALLPLTAGPARASDASPAAIEVRLAELVNEARVQSGAGPLRIDVRIVGGSRSWSAAMLQRGGLSHDPNLRAGMPPSTSAFAENVAYTSAEDDVAARLHRLLMDSSGHRANILDRRFTDVGIGIVVGGGRTFVTQRFGAGNPARVASAVDGLSALAASVFGGGAASHAVIVRDDVYADALTAGPLAGASGPILLTPPGPVLHPSARLALERTLPAGGTVWLVGGTGAVSDGVQAELQQAGYAVRRVSGSDRIGTARAVADQVVARDGPPAELLVTTGWNWPDAIAAGAYGARTSAPVLLTARDTVPHETATAQRALGAGEVVVLGGPSAVGDGPFAQLGARRVAGATRFGTSSAAAESLWGYRDASPSRWIAAPALGDSAWTWALGAAPLSARLGAAILLTGPDLDPEVRSYVEGLGYARANASAELLTVGPVPASGADELRSLLQ